ncbi:winged helix-turn-helix domain-containing protein [Sulfurovum sp.]|uniref:winged helix-turn-helix domain-containing protein n=1 Tax=Sulfurovum sp. TaxID=1969726 RepID=UPI002624FDF5|nr:winged helix-turn-helix domain-containing protein [Sulfurovum sp.]
MLKIKEILRLKCEAKLSNRKIARALNISHSVVNDYIKEFKLTNKKYEDIASLNDKEILTLFCWRRPHLDTVPELMWTVRRSTCGHPAGEHVDTCAS